MLEPIPAIFSKYKYLYFQIVSYFRSEKHHREVTQEPPSVVDVRFSILSLLNHDGHFQYLLFTKLPPEVNTPRKTVFQDKGGLTAALMSNLLYGVKKKYFKLNIVL